MSKFCSKCGAQLDDAAAFCDKCGNAVSPASAPAPAVEQPQQAPAPVVQQPAPVKAVKIDGAKIKGFLKSKKFITAAIAALCAVVLIIASCVVLSNFTGHKAAAKKFLNAFIAEDYDTLVDMSSGIYKSGQIEKSMKGEYEYVSDYFDDKIKKDEDYLLDYKIKTNKEMTKRKFKEILDDIADDGDIDEDTVTAARVIKGKFTAQYNGNKKTATMQFELWLIKEDGKWCMVYFNTDG